MNIVMVYAALMGVTPGSSGLFSSPTIVRELQRFESIEHCEKAAKLYRRSMGDKPHLFCVGGVFGVPK
jgi:hypothetical protein